MIKNEEITMREQIFSYLNELEKQSKIIVESVIKMDNNASNNENLSLDIKSNVEKLILKETGFRDFLNVDFKAFMRLKSEIEKLQSEYDNLCKIYNEYFLLIKKSEEMLASGIFKASEKLQLIKIAEEHKQKPETFIKFAHHISAHDSVIAPNQWAVGDYERPYPQELEMQQSLLHSINNSNLLTDKTMMDFNPDFSEAAVNQNNKNLEDNKEMKHLPAFYMNRPSASSKLYSTGEEEEYPHILPQPEPSHQQPVDPRDTTISTTTAKYKNNRRSSPTFSASSSSSITSSELPEKSEKNGTLDTLLNFDYGRSEYNDKQ